MPLRLFSPLDVLISIGVETPVDKLQGDLFAVPDSDSAGQATRCFLNTMAKKRVHHYLHTDFSLDPFRRCGPWC
jgi:hypothetical protein